MRVDGKFLAVDGKSNFDGTFTALTQHDGKFLPVDSFLFFYGNSVVVDGNSNFDGKSPIYRDCPPVRYFYVGKITEQSPEKNGPLTSGVIPSKTRSREKNPIDPPPVNSRGD